MPRPCCPWAFHQNRRCLACCRTRGVSCIRQHARQAAAAASAVDPQPCDKQTRQGRRTRGASAGTGAATPRCGRHQARAGRRERGDLSLRGDNLREAPEFTRRSPPWRSPPAGRSSPVLRLVRQASKPSRTGLGAPQPAAGGERRPRLPRLPGHGCPPRRSPSARTSLAFLQTSLAFVQTSAYVNAVYSGLKDMITGSVF